MNTKIKSLRSLVTIRISLKKKKKRVVFTNGCFDLMHMGHLTYLRKAKACGDVLIVGVNRDCSVRHIKGRKRPLIPEKERAALLAELLCVDYVVFFSEDTPLRLIRTLKPDVLVKGSDWALKDIVGKGVLDTYGGVVKRIRLVPGRSTSGIIKKIKKL